MPAKTPRARGELLSWLMFVATGIGPYSGQAFHFRGVAPEPREYAQRRYDFETRRHYGILNDHLASRHYMLGEGYTIVDMAVWGWARLMPIVLGDPEAWASVPHVKRLFDEISARPAAVRANAEAARIAQLNQEALSRAEKTAATSILNNQRTDPFIGPRNYRYVAQGDRSLAPLAVWDNGYSTVIQFPGNTRIPSIFVIDPDGKEATATYSVDGNTVQIGQTAREVRLRDGDTVLNIYNLGYNTVGGNPDTGTTSASVQRVIDSDNSQNAGGSP